MLICTRRETRKAMLPYSDAAAFSEVSAAGNTKSSSRLCFGLGCFCAHRNCIHQRKWMQPTVIFLSQTAGRFMLVLNEGRWVADLPFGSIWQSAGEKTRSIIYADGGEMLSPPRIQLKLDQSLLLPPFLFAWFYSFQTFVLSQKRSLRRPSYTMCGKPSREFSGHSPPLLNRNIIGD